MSKKKIICEKIGNHEGYDYNHGPNFVFTLPINRIHASHDENIVYFVGRSTMFVIFLTFFFIGPFAFLFVFCPFDYVVYSKSKNRTRKSSDTNDTIVES